MSVRAILSSVVLVILIAASSTADIGSDESTLIRMVPDGLREVEDAFVKILGQSSHVLSFARFTHKYGKKYQHAEEIKHRFSVFKENLDLIRSTNKKGLSYKLGVNQFADLTFQEFQRNKIGASQHPLATLKGNRRFAETAVPDSKDWRVDGVVSRVKDQGACGASWAFSATGAVESAYHIKYGTGIEISEQQLVDCSYSVGILNCVDGQPNQAFDYMKSKGINNETQYPYLGVQGLCRSNSDSVVNVTGYVNILKDDENELKQTVGSIGPVSVSFGFSVSLQLYKSGVFTSEMCGYEPDIQQYGLVVGYGNDGSLDYWIIKNSWGKLWGDGGYFKLERGKNICLVSAMPMYPIVA